MRVSVANGLNYVVTLLMVLFFNFIKKEILNKIKVFVLFYITANHNSKRRHTPLAFIEVLTSDSEKLAANEIGDDNFEFLRDIQLLKNELNFNWRQNQVRNRSLLPLLEVLCTQ